MLTSRELLAAVRAAQGLSSNYALSKVLDVREKDVSRWNTGQHVPSDPMAVRLAQLANLDPAFVLASLHAQRCTDEQVRPIFERIAAVMARAGTGAAAAILAGFISTTPDAQARATVGAEAIAPTHVEQVVSLYIVAVLRRLAGQLARLFEPCPCAQV